MSERPRVVPPSALVEAPGLKTAGMHRRQAFAAEDRWVGYVSSEPGEWSGWHHHGEHDTYLYVVAGGIEFEYGDAHDRIAVNAGEFGVMPNHVVHRERATAGETAEIVLVRIGQGPTVFNVEDPG